MRCIFTNKTIGIGCFSIGTNRTIGTIVRVCFLLNYFLKKGYTRMIQMNTDKGHGNYS